MPTRLCLMRHGETDWNAQRRLQGQIDVALNAVGRAQARAAAARLTAFSFTRIVSSDLARADETARAAGAALGLAVETTPALRERFFGAFQGLTHAEAAARFPAEYGRFSARDPDAPLPGGGESLDAFFSRVAAALTAIAGETRGDALVVAHGGVLDMARRLAAGQDLREKRDFPLRNAALNWIVWQAGTWSLSDWGDVAHLRGALDESLDSFNPAPGPAKA